MVDMCFGLAMSKDQWDPEFLKAIPIMKTRSGMQVKMWEEMWEETEKLHNLILN